MNSRGNLRLSRSESVKLRIAALDLRATRLSIYVNLFRAHESARYIDLPACHRHLLGNYPNKALAVERFARRSRHQRYRDTLNISAAQSTLS